MKGYYKAVTDELKKHGWWKTVFGKGSHERWTNGNKTTTVSQAPGRILANEIMKQAKIDKKF